MAAGQYPCPTSGTVSQLSNITSYHGSAMPTVTIYCQKLWYREPTVDGMIVIAENDCVNHGGTTSSNGEASHCRHCCASQLTKVNGRPLPAATVRRAVCQISLSEYPPTTLGRHWSALVNSLGLDLSRAKNNCTIILDWLQVQFLHARIAARCKNCMQELHM